MVARDALILAAPEGVEITAIRLAHDLCHVLPVIIARRFDRVRRRDSVEAKPWRGFRCALVNEDVCAYGMIDDHQLVMIDVVGLPQLCGDTQVVIAVAWRELVAANLL